MSLFDPSTFLEMQVAEANSTVSVPVPAGEFMGYIEKVEARPWTSRTDPSKSGVALDVLWNVDDAGVKALLDREKVTVKQGIMLDITETGGLDMGRGKNVGLGRLREATDLNAPGQPFGFTMLVGRPAKIVIEHRPDPKNPEVVYSEVKAVAKL